jgi:hypothetical protein
LTISWTDPVAGAVSEVHYVPVAGTYWLEQNRIFPAGVAVTITLAAGGGSVLGSVYADAEQQVA